jgi:bifunctional non-homologous end joining protein LigD
VNTAIVAVRPRTRPTTKRDVLPLTHPDKPYFPEAKLAKRDIAQYYMDIAPWILPYLQGRPLSLVRCPDGWKGQCFFQKNVDPRIDKAVDRISVQVSDGKATYTGASSSQALVALVQWGVIEMHPWGSRQPHLERPDRLVFDFDPDDKVSWETLVEGVGLLRTLLEEIGLRGFLKTTGGKGLHVVVPIRPTIDWTEAKDFTKSVANLLAANFPERFTATIAKEKRRGKVLIDYLRNAEGATAFPPYVVRARKNAPVATPIEWEELAQDVRLDHFNVRNIRERMASVADPWADFAATKQAITKAMVKRLG